MQKMLLWKVSLAKKGKKKVFKELYFMGEYLIQVSHNAEFLVCGSREHDVEPMFDFEVDIVGIDKVVEVDDIVNAPRMNEFDDDEDEMEENLDWPYKILEVNKNFPEQLKIQFKHSCGNLQKIGWFPWNQLECRDCHKIVEHDQLEEIGGLYIFSEKEDKK